MAKLLRDNAAAIAGATLGIVVVAWLGLTGFAWTDYDDELAPAFKALSDGHAGHFLQLMPAYGGSALLRAPFAMVPALWHGGELAVYRAGSLALLAASGAFGVWLVNEMRKAEVGKLARAVALVLCVASPITVAALDVGHPEEVFVAVAIVGAVVAAERGHVTWAGVLLGIAVASKASALIALGPVLLALPSQRWRCAATATLIAALVLAPLVASGGQFVNINRAVATDTSVIFQPWQAWWWLGEHGHVVRGLHGQIKPGYRAAPGWIGGIAHPLIVVVAAALSLAWARRRWRPAHPDALLLLALVALLRCLLDPWNISYYELPFLFALLTWESITLRRVPVLALAATAISWLVLVKLRLLAAPDVQSLAYLVFAVPAAAAMAIGLYAPIRLARLRGGLNRAVTEPIAVRRPWRAGAG